MHVFAAGLLMPAITEAHELSGLSSSNSYDIFDCFSAGIQKVFKVPQKTHLLCTFIMYVECLNKQKTKLYGPWPKIFWLLLFHISVMEKDTWAITWEGT